MIKKFNLEKLLYWFDSNKKEYPWGEKKSPYRVWISEIMLQQTVAASVIPFFERWMTDYPDLQTLASADLNEVLSHWEGLGYYSRCRNLHKAAAILVESFNGSPPGSYKELNSIPGIGDYTARAILSIAYKKPYAVLDANVRRIVQRLSATIDWSKELDKSTIEVLETMIPEDRPGDFNEAMMQLGQLICTTGSPKCTLCPLESGCIGYKTGIAETIPEKKKKKINTVNKTALLFCSEGKILLRKKKSGVFHDLWLIPTEEINCSEKILSIKEEWPHMAVDLLKRRNHFYTDNKDILSPIVITSNNIDLTNIKPEDNDLFTYKWIGIEELKQHPSPSVYRKILDEAVESL